MSASFSSARRARLARQARLASHDSECLAFLANLACLAHPHSFPQPDSEYTVQISDERGGWHSSRKTEAMMRSMTWGACWCFP